MALHQGPIFSLALQSISGHSFRHRLCVSLTGSRQEGSCSPAVRAALRCRCWRPARCAGRTCAARRAARGSARTASSHTGTGSRRRHVPWTSQDTETRCHSPLLQQNTKCWHVHGSTHHQDSPKLSLAPGHRAPCCPWQQHAGPALVLPPKQSQAFVTSQPRGRIRAYL